MVEKVITLENISLLDFLGVENKNIKKISNAFPESKIVSRGNEILIQGSTPEIIKINDILNSLLTHYHKYGKLTEESVQLLINSENKPDFIATDDDILIYGTRGAVIKPKTPNQKSLVESAAQNDLVFAIGPAGTGKTYISVALAVKALKNKRVKKIIITRPAVEAGENLGFLPGDLKEKIDPYLRPIYDALFDMVPSEKLKFYEENKVIEIAPLAYMRGRTLQNAFILLDEAQNTTPMQIKMFLTRMGPNSKVIVTGDRSQIDLPKNHKSGLIETLEVLKGVKGIGFVELGGEDVVRHKLVKDIIEAYERADNLQINE
ncbi:phosphate starvation-inducible PhoH-like protein [Catalinimonas alkaloidigena]|uniref:PhoH family protein n=1 Tax=Catalinimonas alkaloidigena TaxID=1075417 RepID=UPI002406E8E9|nr:PhoH family protein [Catalinimonas alkaloidigena]MDF9795868.1 phosphate starvation-inducible PhoH-like protein [Catalinimonas alkaloidigena]